MIRCQARLRRGTFELDVSFESGAGTIALFGPSGSGKSTVLALIAGLLRPDSGRLEIDAEPLFDTDMRLHVPPHRRRIGLVFQDALLFPHLTVRQNLLYGRRFGRHRAGRESVDAVTALLGIEHLLERRPAGLSGGERQRVAIGRAVLSDPRLLLFDEPLSALDYERRLEIIPYIGRLHREMGIPFVYVSHAVEEVARLAEHVVMLEHGRVTAAGAPGDVLAPAWGAGLEARFGAVSVVDATVRAYDPAYGLTVLDHPAGTLSVPGAVGEAGCTHRVVVRATDVALAAQRPREVSYRTVLQGRIVAIATDEGPLARVDLDLRGGGRLVSLVTRKSVDELGLDRGDDVYAMVKAVSLDERAIAFAPRGPLPRAGTDAD